MVVVPESELSSLDGSRVARMRVCRSRALGLSADPTVGVHRWGRSAPSQKWMQTILWRSSGRMTCERPALSLLGGTNQVAEWDCCTNPAPFGCEGPVQLA